MTTGRRFAMTLGSLVAVAALAGPAVAAPGEPAVTEQVAFSTSLPVGRDFLDMVAGDMNGDGDGDLVGASSDLDDYGTLYVLLGDGSGGFAQSTRMDSSATQPVLVLVDFDNDGRLDLAVGDDDGRSGGIAVYFGDGAGGFASSRVIPGMALVKELSAGDFDGDGNVDLAAYVTRPNRIGILYGNGRGRFTAPVILARSIAVDDLLVADVSGDGRDDVVVSRLDIDAVSVSVSRGRSFTPARSYPTGDNPTALAAGDVDGDGRLDLLTITGAGFDDFADLTLLRGLGGGRFGPPETDPDVGSPVALPAATDMNGDGLVDVVLAESRPFATRDRMTVRLGDGTGNFGTPSQFSGDTVFPNVVADLAGDALPDVVAGGVGASDTALRINITGQPTLSVADVTVVEGADSVTFTVRRSASSASSTVRYGTVDGSAAAPADYTATAGILSFAAGERTKTVIVPIVDDAVGEVEESFTFRLTDAVGAGLLDPIGVATIQDDDLTLPPVSFAPPTLLTTDPDSLKAALTTGDLDGDGNLDLVETRTGFAAPAVGVSLGDGTGDVGPTASYPTVNSEAVTTADLNADGAVDVISAGDGGAAGPVSVRLGDGTGVLGAERTFPVAGSRFMYAISSGEFTGDGVVDVVVRGGSSSIWVLPGDGEGLLLPAVKIGSGQGGRIEDLRVSDLNGDGIDDVVTGDLIPDRVTTLVSRSPSGSFTQTNYPASQDPNNGAGSVTTADFDGDGAEDVAVHAGFDVNTGEGLVSVRLGDGIGGLGSPLQLRTLGGDSVLEAGDFNGDGRPDLASIGSVFEGSAVLLGDGSGGFATYAPIEDGDGGIRGTSADFDSDGRPDLIIGDNADTSVLRNTSG